MLKQIFGDKINPKEPLKAWRMIEEQQVFVPAPFPISFSPTRSSANAYMYKEEDNDNDNDNNNSKNSSTNEETKTESTSSVNQLQQQQEKVEAKSSSEVTEADAQNYRVHEQPPNTIRFVCLSDTHSMLDAINVPDGDVLIHAGDFTDTGTLPQIQKFCASLAKLPHRHKVVIAGNHDLSLDEESYVTAQNWKRFRHKQIYSTSEGVSALKSVCTYLLDEEVTVEGYRIYGSPWQPRFYDWAFNVSRGDAAQAIWDKIPNGTDILITHGPPLGRGDQCSDGFRAGCYNLLNTIQTRVKPLVHVFGHIHEDYGVSCDQHTTYINASNCTLRYDPLQSPVVFDLPKRV